MLDGPAPGSAAVTFEGAPQGSSEPERDCPPLVLVVDDGWAAAGDGWEERRQTLSRLAERAQRSHREVVLVRTAPDPGSDTVQRMSATDAVRMIPSLEPKPWPVDRPGTARALADERLQGAEVVWLSDGIAGSAEERRAARAFGNALSDLGSLSVYADAPVGRPHQQQAEPASGAQHAFAPAIRASRSPEPSP